MFTIKLYRDNGFRQVIQEAEAFTILRQDDGTAEVTLHRTAGPNGEYRDVRFDLADPEGKAIPGSPEAFEKAIIENAAGKTTEIITWTPSRLQRPSQLDKAA